ncbi:HIT family protein [Pseudomonas citronellolis]|uniref:HIT family protein n=1 Tax=Pseudomonas citronellolis TaxID=53408 RepID=UPI0020A1F3FA|nr:HIT family protein [Pseudomonas citronellolis]MCP1604954.1 diadenosine tetraphosphate (Ap4A) HIT family hydrolase [Pseudomonas citronellolis]MCP1655807.1 diadenosine tetraphosphate (Ap4A) HIT family hydrolase [Pseudomonas citronellolis]MCP1722857.1 diadenosine tetraphosphate (Ap4A) HIT family hydrolase [Pseudomonas citronellolis]
MDIPAHLIVHQTQHWILNHHLTSALPGYLMLGSRAPAGSLADLPAAALAELGELQGLIQRILEEQLQPKWLYIGRFGHSPGFPIHFHFIPVYSWVEDAFWADERYRVLQRFGDSSLGGTDGAELTLFIWREFGEAEQAPVIHGPGIDGVIARLREAFGQVACG